MGLGVTVGSHSGVTPEREGGFRYEDGDFGRWHAVMTNHGAEKVANEALAARGYETLFLHYEDTVRHARRVETVVRPYFARYLFLRVGARQPYYPISCCHGVSTLVCAGKVPLAVPLEVIEELRDRAGKQGLMVLAPEEKTSRRRYRPGETVRITSDPFAGFLATVDLDTGPQIRVWLGLFKGRVRVDLSPDQVSPKLRSRGDAARPKP